jgi:cytochrome P450
MGLCPFTHQTIDGKSEYNLLTKNPHPVYNRLRSESPLYYEPKLNLWVVSRYKDISSVLKDTRHFSSIDAIAPTNELPPAVMEVLNEGYSGKMAMLMDDDPPDHTRLRNLVKDTFAPERVAMMESRIQEIANELVDSFVDDGQADLMMQYAYPLPMTVICEIMGLPRADMNNLKRWCDDWGKLLWQPMSLEEQIACARSFVSLQHYFADKIEQRRTAPKDDILSKLLYAPSQGEKPLSTAELVKFACLLLVAGNEATTKMICNALVQLVNHCDLLQAIQEDPSLATNFVEEALRIDTSIKAVFRTTRQEVELAGVLLPEGARILVVLTSGNHDETQFSDADRFDIYRENIARHHLSFGNGIHYCLGAPLARLQLRVTLKVLTQRLPKLRFQQPEQSLHYITNLMLRGLEHLPLEWDVVAVLAGS